VTLAELIPAYVERPVFFDTSRGRVFGIVTLPASGTPHTGFVILPGAGSPITVNRNRLSVRVCRDLAALGYAAMRCDYHGTGESTGVVEGFRLDEPFTEDVLAGVARLREFGVRPVVLAGSCYGGRCALAAATELDDVAALLLIATTPRDYERGERKSTKAAESWGLGRYVAEAVRPRRIRGLFNRKSRRHYAKYARAKLQAVRSRDETQEPTLVAPSYERHYRRLLKRGVPIVQMFGQDDSSNEEYGLAASGPLADALDAAPGLVQVRTIPGKIHGFLNPPVQDAVVEEILAWAREHEAPMRAEPSPSRADS
jgi:pimeloyl-ACP methyl ester carboxylesterase